MFRKSLLDARAALKKGDKNKALKIIKDHYEEHVSEAMNTTLSRLNKKINRYHELLKNLVRMGEKYPLATIAEEIDKAEESLEGIQRNMLLIMIFYYL
jgi:uncharacterized protein Yka (UPF0111/DUF47 family)